MATFNFGMGATVDSVESMAIVAYSYLPSIVSTVLDSHRDICWR